MPAYCHSCPYKKFCKEDYIDQPTCPMGYSPVKSGTKNEKVAAVGSGESTTHVFKPEILLKIGKATMNRNEYQTAIDSFEKILVIDQNNREATFLLKRAKYMLDGPSTKEPAATEETKSDEKKEEYIGMLPQQERKRIMIKPKQQYEINPDIIEKKADKVYQVQTEDSEEEKVLEDVSKHVARKSKGSIMSKKGTLIVLGLAISIIIMIVVGLWQFGFL